MTIPNASEREQSLSNTPPETVNSAVREQAMAALRAVLLCNPKITSHDFGVALAKAVNELILKENDYRLLLKQAVEAGLSEKQIDQSFNIHLMILRDPHPINVD